MRKQRQEETKSKKFSFSTLLWKGDRDEESVMNKMPDNTNFDRFDLLSLFPSMF